MKLELLEAGFGVTVQDAGRTGRAHLGIPESGAMDIFALQAANLLVGNEPGAAGLEIPSGGFCFRPHKDSLIACTGPGWSLEVDGGPQPGWMAVLVKAGQKVEVIHGSGRWGYIAVAEGIDVPNVLGSRSTYLRGGFGGFCGRALAAGDRLPCIDPQINIQDRVGANVPRGSLPSYSARVEARVTPGPEFRFFDSELFFRQVWRVGNRSDRMGYALEGAELKSMSRVEIITSAVIPGVIQAPPGGAPIVLMRDAQSTGGYPRFAVVVQADLGLIAQLNPGDEVTFRQVSLEEARLAGRMRHQM